MEGPSKEYENRPNYIVGGMAAYDWLHCEVDVWLQGSQFFLGHDAPQYPVNEEFLTNARLWCHAKNLDAFYAMLSNPLIHCFWHQEDAFALTSRGYIWTAPGQELTENSICVLPEIQNTEISSVAGICTDFIGRYNGGTKT